MEKLWSKLKLQTIIAFIVLMSMLTSIISPIAYVYAETTGNEPTSYVNFTSNWLDGGTSIVADSNKEIGVKFGITLTGGPTFKNLSIYAEDITEDTSLPNAVITIQDLTNTTVSANGQSLQFNENVNSGYATEGNVKIMFERTSDFSEYDKTIQLTLTGEYELNGEVIQINEVRTLTAHVKPTPIIYGFYATTRLDVGKTNRNLKEYYSDTHWAVDDFTIMYNINVNSKNESYSRLKLTIDRTALQGKTKTELNNEENLVIGVADNAGYNIEVVREENGTTYLDMTRGESIENYDGTTQLRYSSSTIKIQVQYKVIEDTTQLGTGQTLVTADLEAYAEGFTTVKNGEGTSGAKNHYEYQMSKERGVTLWSNPIGNKPGNDYDTSITGYDMTSSQLQTAVDNQKLQVTYHSYVLGKIKNVNEEDDERLKVRNYSGSEVKLKYKQDGVLPQTVILNNNEMTLNKITISQFDDIVQKIEFYHEDDIFCRNEPFFTATKKGDEYIAPAGANITGYIALITGYDDTTIFHEKLADWDTKWDIDLTNLINTYGEENIRNTRSITRKQISTYAIGSQTLYADIQEYANVYINFESDEYASYATLNVDSSYNTDVANLKDWENNKSISVNFNGENVKNINPKLYVKLPAEFEYRNYKVKLTGADALAYVKSYKTETINGEEFLVIDIEGALEGSSPTLTITHDRYLKEPTTITDNKYLDVEVYMLTDNENYVDGIQVNSYEFEKEKDGISIVPTFVTKKTKSFSVTGTNVKEVKTLIYDNFGNQQVPGEKDDGTFKKSSKENPLGFEKGSTIKYQSELHVSEHTLSNLDFIIRLPKENNMPITNNTYNLDSVISLTDLSNIKVDYKNDETHGISQDKYTIKYSTSENATYDSEFTVLDDETDLSTVKTLRITFTDDFTVNDGDKLIISYEMKMPNTIDEGIVGAKIAGATTAVKYTRTDGVDEQPLESTPAYVEQKNTKGTINLTKKFEGYAVGTAPAGVSLQGIKFKFINKKTQEVLVLPGQTDTEGIIETDANGTITLNFVPEGTYEVIETSEFDDYQGIEYTTVTVEQGVAIPSVLEVENKIKKATLTIEKKWKYDENKYTSEQPLANREDVIFEITNLDTNEIYAKKMDRETGITTFVGITYGTYKIEEVGGAYGWHFASGTETIDVHSKNVTFEVENELSKGTIIITKTVPNGDDVRNITFNITSSSISYKNAEGESVSLNQNIKLNIGDYNTNPRANINVDLNETAEGELPSKATITLTNMPMGSYKIEEVDIPTIEGTSTEMYQPVLRRINLDTKDQVVRVDIENNWQAGRLKIIKTVDTEGIDLTQFKVRVKLEDSVYPNTFDKVFDMPASGELIIPNLFLGTYTVTELDSDYYNAKYGEEKSSTPEVIEIKQNQTSVAYIHNENTYGYVKIRKKLEGVKAENAIGIQFRLSGKDTAGNQIEPQIITITDVEVDEATNEEYGVGISNLIQAGGEYELTEVYETLLTGYVEMDPIAVDVKKENMENPVVVTIENKKARGNLDITTKTIPEGGPITPIRYAVTEVSIKTDENGKPVIKKVGKRTELTAIAGHSELNAIYAGMYLVELLEVPKGYEMDRPQLVEVPQDETGYAEFEIEKTKALVNATLFVEKEIIKSDGTIATDEDLAKAQLSANESFEVRVVNTETQKVYYTFFDKEEPGKIKGLVPGTYEIEELYKPKYLNTSYLLKNGDEYTEINDTDGKYLFEISEVPEDSEVSVTIKVQNTINLDFGFGGQSSKDNYSTTTMEQLNNVTKTVIYITDENGNAIEGAKFQIRSSGRNIVQLPFANNTYTSTKEKKVIINGLPTGTYTIENIEVPEGYVTAEDKAITVFDGATLVVRIEIWKDTPRGNIELSTTYTTYNNGERQTIFVPRSKYSIVNAETGKTLKFEKTISGDYIRSNSDTATEVINLRAGKVEVKGLDVGNYEIGLVDLTEKYGVINTEVEEVTVLQNQTIQKEVPVKVRGAMKKAVSTYSGSWLLSVDEEGDLYVNIDDYSVVKISEADASSSSPYIKFLKDFNAKVKDIAYCENGKGYFAIVDFNGKVWTNYYGYEKEDVSSYTIYYPECISDLENNPFNVLRVEKVFCSTSRYYEPTFYAIDENGKVWMWGNTSHVPGMPSKTKTPICISNDTILENVKIKQVSGNDNAVHLIDTEGNLYFWGAIYHEDSGIDSLDNVDQSLLSSDNFYIIKPICLTTLKGNALEGVKIKEVSRFVNCASFVDYEGNLWVCGGSYSEISNYTRPKCLTQDSESILYNKKIVTASCDDRIILVVDSEGGVYSWGYGSTWGSDFDRTKEPNLVTGFKNTDSKPLKLKYINGHQTFAYAIDENGTLWTWGRGTEGYGNFLNLPTKMNVVKNAHFDLFEVKSINLGKNNAMILDEQGQLWTAGNFKNILYLDEDYEIRNYTATSIGANLENIKVKDYGVDSYNTYVIDANNRLWTMGLINKAYRENKTDSYVNRTHLYPICLTDIGTSPLYGKEIVYAATDKFSTSGGSSIAVIDSKGNIYTAGEQRCLYI